MKYSIIFILAFSFSMFLYWVAGYEFERGKIMIDAILNGMFFSSCSVGFVFIVKQMSKT